MHDLARYCADLTGIYTFLHVFVFKKPSKLEMILPFFFFVDFPVLLENLNEKNRRVQLSAQMMNETFLI